MEQPFTWGPIDKIELDIMELLQSDKPEAEKKGALVEELLSRFEIGTMDDTDEMLNYDGGIFKAGAKNKLIAEMESIGLHLINNHMRNEVLASIRARTYVQRADFDKDPAVLNLKNGLLNIQTGKFLDHTSEYPSMIQLPVDYNPNATCRPIIEFLYDMLVDPKDVPLVLEHIAYCLFADKDLQKELTLTGPPDSGKSVLLFLITAVLGGGNVSNITMQQLSSNRFALAQLEGKLANIYADISHARLEDIEKFKAIATADELEAERKGMQLFKFKPRAKLIFSANILPKPPVTVDDSFYRRWTIIQCALRDRHYFSGKPIIRDPKLLHKLNTPENLSGLLNLILISARRLMKNQRFCKVVSTDETRELYDRLSNPVQLWIETCCEEDESGHIEKDAGYASYIKFCKQRKIGALTKEWLGKELARLGYLDGYKGDSRKDRKKVWLGITLGEGKGAFPSLTNQGTLLMDRGKGALPIPTENQGEISS
jgi:putative DNA primase/helicase